MFKKISAAIQYSIREEDMRDRSARMLLGALYGALIACAYILALSTVNVISFPGYHLAVDWVKLVANLAAFGIGLGLGGVIVGWFTENYQGVVGGGLLMTVLVLAGNVIVSLVSGSSAGGVIQSFITSLPLIGAAVLIALGLRALINRHINAKKEAPPRRRKLLAGQVSLVLFVGLFLGFLGRFDISTIKTLQALNDGLQHAKTDPVAAGRFPVVRSLPALKDHFGTDYRLFIRPSISYTGSTDITIRFMDGYTVTCLVSTDAGLQTFFTTCNEGTSVNAP
jgi:hypothetical protein